MLRTAARFLPLAALLLFVAGLSLRPMAESDLFFHLKAGQEILARHGLPGRNLYSFTAPDYPDLDTSWLAEVGAAAVFARGGFPAVVVAKTLVLLIAFAGAYRLCRRRGAGAVASALALAAAAFVGRDRFVERPHIFSLAGAVATLCGDRRPAGTTERTRRRPRARRPGFSPPSSCGPTCTPGCSWRRFWSARRRWGSGRSGATGRGRAGWPCWPSGAALATLATPVGWGLVRYLRLHLVLPALHPVDEFRAPTWLSDGALVVYAGAFVAAAVFLVATGDGPARRRELAGSALLAAILPLGILAAHSVRFGADFALVAAPLLAIAATMAGDRLRLRLGRRLPGLAQLLRSPLPAVATAALLIGFSIAPRLAADRRSVADSGSASTRASCPWRPSPSPTTTGCASGCTTTSRSGRTSCSSRWAATREAGCSSIRGCRPTHRRCTVCSGGATFRATTGKRRWIATASTARSSPTRASTGGSPGGTRRAGRWSGAGATRACSCGGCRALPRSSPRTRSRPPSHFRSKRGRRRFRSIRARRPRRSPTVSGAGGSGS